LNLFHRRRAHPRRHLRPQRRAVKSYENRAACRSNRSA
jgi:hypothetical protein